MRDAVIVPCEPVGKRNGGLSGVHPADLSAHVLTSLVERAGADPALVDDRRDHRPAVWVVATVGALRSRLGS